MAQKTITDLQLISAITDAVNMPGDTGTQSFRLTVAQLKAFLLANENIVLAMLKLDIFTGLTAVAPAVDDYIPLVDTSDANKSKKALISEIVAAALSSQNYAMNAAFRFFQRQVPATLTTFADAAYGPDRWKVLSENTSVQVAQVSAHAINTVNGNRSTTAIQVRQINATGSRFGIVQVLPADKVKELSGKTITLSFVAATDGTEVPNLRAGIIEWTGTQDVVTSDLVSAWGSTPTLVAGAAFLNTPADIAITSTPGVCTVSAAVGNSMNNLAIMIWAPAAEAQNDDFYISKVQLVTGTLAKEWTTIAKAPQADLYECQAYYEKSYDLAAAPATLTYNGVEKHEASRTITIAAPNQTNVINFKTTKFKTPTCAVYDPNDGSNGFVYEASSGAHLATTLLNQAQRSFAINYAQTDTRITKWHWTAIAEL